MLHLKNHEVNKCFSGLSLASPLEASSNTSNAGSASSIPGREALGQKNNINQRFLNHSSAVEEKIIKVIAVIQLMLKETRKYS